MRPKSIRKAENGGITGDMVRFLGWFLSAGWTSSSFYKEKLPLKVRSDKAFILQTKQEDALCYLENHRILGINEGSCPPNRLTDGRESGEVCLWSPGTLMKGPGQRGRLLTRLRALSARFQQTPPRQLPSGDDAES